MFKDNITVLGDFIDEVLLSIAFETNSDEDKSFQSLCALQPKAFNLLKKSYSTGGKQVNYRFYIERKNLRLLNQYQN